MNKRPRIIPMQFGLTVLVFGAIFALMVGVTIGEFIHATFDLANDMTP